MRRCAAAGLFHMCWSMGGGEWHGKWHWAAMGVHLAVLAALTPHTRAPPARAQIVSAWQGMAISAFATAARVLPHEQPPAAREFPVEGRNPQEYLQAALKVRYGRAGSSGEGFRWSGGARPAGVP